MDQAVDPRVQRFLERHAVSVREAVEADVADHREQTPADRWRILTALSRTMDWWRARPAKERARMLDARDAPHPSYRELVSRLRGS